jgi:hypothetical protein
MIESNLLQTLKDSLANCSGIVNARTVHFVFDSNDDVAFLSEIAIEDLVPLLEDWCQHQRQEMKGEIKH